MRGMDPKESLLLQIRGAGLPPPQVEYRFHDTRKWLIDFAWPAAKVGVEYDGIFGRESASHMSRKGIMRDQEKSNEAQVAGWVLLRVNAATVEDGKALAWIEKAMWRER
jgi:very-short-patch-repair endonuclease